VCKGKEWGLQSKYTQGLLLIVVCTYSEVYSMCGRSGVEIEWKTLLKLGNSIYGFYSFCLGEFDENCIDVESLY
jgi:hypothetical protein